MSTYLPNPSTFLQGGLASMSMGRDVGFEAAEFHGGFRVDSPRARVADPSPLGLSAFALTTFVHSYYTASGLPPPAVVAGLSIFYGGLAGLLAGMWSLARGNTFAGTTFSSYGAFRLSLGVTLVCEEDPVAAVLLAWTAFSVMMWGVTLAVRANLALRVVFGVLSVTFGALAVAEFVAGSVAGHRLKRAGGCFGVITALIAWYMALAGLLTPENSYFTLPVGKLRPDHQP